MKKYVLALDEGTTSARAILFDKNGEVVAMAQHELGVFYPHPGWVEEDPMEIYSSQYASITECVAKSGIDPDEIAAVGITNQRETVVAWNKTTGKPVCPAIVWQCRRTAQMCHELVSSGLEEAVKRITGLRIDPYFSATKMKWILDNVGGARELADSGELLFGTVDTWLIWKLTEGRVFVTDRTNASRTMLYNIHALEWDEELLRRMGIPRSALPEVISSSETVGECKIMGARVPISGIAGDQQAALFGQGCFSHGDVKNTYGTGCFLLAHTGNTPVASDSGLITTIAATEQGRLVEYALEGSVFVGGAVLKWLRDGLGLIRSASESEDVASSVKSTGGVYFVPAFAGLGAPVWDSLARGTLVGLTAGSGRAHIVRAALESIAHQTEDVLSCMRRDVGVLYPENSARVAIKSLRVDGGASQNDLLMQIQSDLSGIAVERPKCAEATARGAAFLAGLAVGFWRTRDELPTDCGATVFTPKTDEITRKEQRHGWQRALLACRAFTDTEESSYDRA